MHISILVLAGTGWRELATETKERRRRESEAAA